jgi:hypothetical protein
MTKNLSRLLGLLLLASSSIKTGELTGQEAIGKQIGLIFEGIELAGARHRPRWKHGRRTAVESVIASILRSHGDKRRGFAKYRVSILCTANLCPRSSRGRTVVITSRKTAQRLGTSRHVDG